MNSGVQAARPPRQWITAVEAGKIGEMCRHEVPRFAAAAGVRTRKLPGRKNVQYSRRDILKALERFVTKAG
jgi:hypothetical protein